MTDTSLEMTTRVQGAVLSDGACVADYLALLKPRVMSLVVFTGLAGLVAAPGDLHPVLGAVAVLCIAVGGGAAGALNMWYERDSDRLMRRTMNRPLPAGRLAAGEALGFGVVLAVGSVATMGLAANWTAAALLGLAIAFYVFVYTIWIKRRTPQNIVIGGAAGAFPPMIGWAAATGAVSVESIVLFLIIFFWTPPHFWALALCCNSDYARAGIPMLPMVAGPRETKKQMLAYTVLLIPVSLGPGLIGLAGPLYGVAAVTLSLLFVLCAVRVWFDETSRSARLMFGFSILYLFLVFAALIADRAVTAVGV